MTGQGQVKAKVEVWGQLSSALLWNEGRGNLNQGSQTSPNSKHILYALRTQGPPGDNLSTHSYMCKETEASDGN